MRLFLTLGNIQNCVNQTKRFILKDNEKLFCQIDCAYPNIDFLPETDNVLLFCFVFMLRDLLTCLSHDKAIIVCNDLLKLQRLELYRAGPEYAPPCMY